MEKLIVVITTYNLEKYISKAIDSVLMQKTNFKFKILIGDDASVDNTQDILKSYKEKYPEIIELKLSEKNMGSLCNSNRLLDGLQCEYFTFLDGDDFWEDENRLQKQIDFMDSHPDYMMCAGNTQYIRNGVKAEYLLKANELGKTYTFEDYIASRMPFFHVSSILLRNKIYINGIPNYYKQAEKTFENCALRGEDFRRINHLEFGPLYAMPDLFSYYRIHDEGMWSGSSDLKRLIESTIQNNFLRKYFLKTNYFNYFNINFSNSYSLLMKYLIIKKNIGSSYNLSKKDTFLLTSLFNDLAEQNISFTPLQEIKYISNKSIISLMKRVCRKIKSMFKF